MDEARKQRAMEAVAKYRDGLASDERIAAFAVWFAQQEFGFVTPAMDAGLAYHVWSLEELVGLSDDQVVGAVA